MNVGDMARTFGEASLVVSDLVWRPIAKKRKAKKKEVKQVSPDVPPDHVADFVELSVAPLAMTSRARGLKIQTYGVNTQF
ncbi:hypothetical protein [Rhizobium rhizogenes]|uniref:hypothetical protein n=1 Tax=Rhizobium rhizogenes TaxID=359 RepID=UPI0022B66DB3|nr:hypothetical protein [Rhizobium rhizogenes]MCZ7448275.1 hypothetical protein [Rhizobium rhizogenes]MCZ7465708.1 hypothetical protein [Rhizobium rhizogenes]